MRIGRRGEKLNLTESSSILKVMSPVIVFLTALEIFFRKQLRGETGDSRPGEPASVGWKRWGSLLVCMKLSVLMYVCMKVTITENN